MKRAADATAETKLELQTSYSGHESELDERKVGNEPKLDLKTKLDTRREAITKKLELEMRDTLVTERDLELETKLGSCRRRRDEAELDWDKAEAAD